MSDQIQDRKHDDPACGADTDDRECGGSGMWCKCKCHTLATDDDLLNELRDKWGEMPRNTLEFRAVREMERLRSVEDRAKTIHKSVSTGDVRAASNYILEGRLTDG